MALLIWLPLNGDLKNLGLSSVTIINSGAIVDNNGKIGKCYNFNGNSEIITSSIDTSSWINYSICCWIKADSTISDGTWHRIGGAAEHTFFLLDMSSKDVVRFFISQDGTTSGIAVYATNSIVDGSWHHLCGIADNTKIALYIDGELIGTTTRTAIYYPKTAIVRVGNTYTGSKFKGLINDFRIYDHALSYKEVKELAKGLILHYRLSKPMPNLLNGNSHLSSAWVGDNATVTNNSDNSIKIISSAANGRIYNSLSNVWTSGKKYTVSFEAKSDTAGTTIDASRSINANNFTQVFSLTTSWLHYVGIINCNATATGGTLSIRINLNNRTVYLRSIKLEEGEKETGYIPPINSNLYSALGYNSNIESDCSGYKRDGIITGTLTAAVDTPRYRTSSNITNNSSYIKIDNLLTSGFSNSYSFSWWGKISNFNKRMFWGFSNGIRLNGIYNGNLWNTGDSSDNPIYIPGTTTLITVPSINIWHHFVMTGDGTNCKLYLDGKYYGIAKTYKSISGTTIYINGWDSGTSYSGQIYISDFRIYCTALSEVDIKALYNDSASIDKNGNFHAYEYIENDNIINVNINKQGVFTIPEEIMENSLKEPSIDDENIYAKGEFYED